MNDILGEKVTTMKVRRSTTDLLRIIAKQRNRKETLEQVILELIDAYYRETK